MQNGRWNATRLRELAVAEHVTPTHVVAAATAEGMLAREIRPDGSQPSVREVEVIRRRGESPTYAFWDDEGACPDESWSGNTLLRVRLAGRDSQAWIEFRPRPFGRVVLVSALIAIVLVIAAIAVDGRHRIVLLGMSAAFAAFSLSALYAWRRDATFAREDPDALARVVAKANALPPGPARRRVEPIAPADEPPLLIWPKCTPLKGMCVTEPRSIRSTEPVGPRATELGFDVWYYMADPRVVEVVTVNWPDAVLYRHSDWNLPVARLVVTREGDARFGQIRVTSFVGWLVWLAVWIWLGGWGLQTVLQHAAHARNDGISAGCIPLLIGAVGIVVLTFRAFRVFRNCMALTRMLAVVTM